MGCLFIFIFAVVRLGQGQDGPSDRITRMSTRQRFRALLEADGTNLKWVIAWVPFAPEKVWKTRRGKRVKGTINGFGFRPSLFGPRARGDCGWGNRGRQK